MNESPRDNLTRGLTPEDLGTVELLALELGITRDEFLREVWSDHDPGEDD